ncbi:hypothetical protein AB835_00520 [Candidatus Endobugula sertula]|uniref:Type VI secretion system-associated protein n=1 Tax=Candidatus Endobugula sertula TaxID=62101 RepID=A0A1D2QTZ8_9GAMM|nr:hypothetical protein AB835_00520 [Candidatus Endobugula sertula]
MSSSKVASINRVQSSAINEDLTSCRLPRAICWHEGMLLSPHHFQQNHQYWERQLSRLIATLSPNFWGVGELVFNQAALLEGEVDIQRLVAILPDGFVVDYDSQNDEPLKVTLEEVGAEPVTVQLTIPIQVPGSASERSEIQRYSSRDGQPNIDENTGDNEMILPRLVPKLSLQVTDRVGNRYVGLPLFRIVKPEGGSLQLDPEYCPPLLSIGADKFRSGTEEVPGPKPIQHRARTLALFIRQKAMQLAGVAENGDGVGTNISQRHHRWIRAMVQELVAFELIAEASYSLPRKLYEALVRMAGPISELAPNSIPPHFPAYCHDDNLPYFNKVMKYIQDQVDRVNLNYSTLSFDNEREGVFTLMFDKAWEGRDIIIELRPSANDSREGVEKWIKVYRIASINLHKDLSERRLLGAKAECIEREEKSGIVPSPGNALFRIAADKRFISVGVKLVIVATNSKVKDHIPHSILIHIPHE